MPTFRFTMERQLDIKAKDLNSAIKELSKVVVKGESCKYYSVVTLMGIETKIPQKEIVI